MERARHSARENLRPPPRRGPMAGLVRLRPVELALRPTLERHRAGVAALGAGLAIATAVSFLTPEADVGLLVFGYVLGAGAPLTGIFFVEGIVSRDLESGAALLWLQKPVRPALYYLGRFMESVLAALLAVLAFSAVAAAVLVARGAAPADRVLAVIPLLLLFTLLCACITFGFSGFGLRRDAAATVLFLLASAVPLGLHAVDPTGTEAWWRWARALLPPVEPAQTLAAYLIGDATTGVGAKLAWYLAYCAAWTTVGVAATTWTMRSPFTRTEAR